jgi:hypothetical protein
VNKKDCIDGIIETIGREALACCEAVHADLELTAISLNALRTRSIYPKDMQEHGFMVGASHLNATKVLDTYHRSRCLGAVLEAIPDLLTDPELSLHVLTSEQLSVIHSMSLVHANLDNEGFLASNRSEEFPYGVLNAGAIIAAAQDFGLSPQRAPSR